MVAVIRLLLCTVLVALSQAVPSSAFELPEKARGQAIEAALGPGGMGQVASEYGMSVANFRALINRDSDIWVDKKGKLFYACEGLGEHAGHHHHHHHHHHRHLKEGKRSERRSLLAQPPIANSDAFNLHSRPGASLVIYLDFNGEVVDDSLWQGYVGMDSFTCPPYDIDGSPASFSDEERDRIIKIWQAVADDYSPWDVDVTTVDPGKAALTNTGDSDQNWGVRVIFGICEEVRSLCKCAGIAYLGTFDRNEDCPVFVFNTDANGAAVAASHEVGHALRLYHDGTSAEGYYRGHGAGSNSWAPIMGVGYGKAVVQWSRGEYQDANNQEDDLSIITSYLPLRPDDHGSSTATATLLAATGAGPSVSVSVDGVISSSGQSDYFRIEHSGGDISAFLSGDSYSPNANCQVQLHDSGGNVLVTAPLLSPLQGSSLPVSTQPAGTYYLSVTGMGFGSPFNTGYSNYGSLGQYWMDVNYAIPGCNGDLVCDSFEDAASCPSDCNYPPPLHPDPPTFPNSPPSSPAACNFNNICEVYETVAQCPSDCVVSSYIAGDGVCSSSLGEDCYNSNDCAGVTNGKPDNRYCCGSNTFCSDNRCTSGSTLCYDTDPVCGDGTCMFGIEDTANHKCVADCTPQPLSPSTPPSSPLTPQAPADPSTPPSSPLTPQTPQTPQTPTLPSTPPSSPADECNFNNICEVYETAAQCPSDCVVSSYIAGDGVCSSSLGEDCYNSNDCAGVTNGKPDNRYCCGSNTFCSDSRCTSGSTLCYDTDPVCGDSTCMLGIEDTDNHMCVADCS